MGLLKRLKKVAKTVLKVAKVTAPLWSNIVPGGALISKFTGGGKGGILSKFGGTDQASRFKGPVRMLRGLARARRNASPMRRLRPRLKVQRSNILRFRKRSAGGMRRMVGSAHFRRGMRKALRY